MEIRAYRGLVNPRFRYIPIIIKGRRSVNSGEMEVYKYFLLAQAPSPSVKKLTAYK